MLEDPLYYVPLDAIRGDIKNKSDSNPAGFWTASLHGGEEAGSSVNITVFETGALKGLVKVAGDSLGKGASSSPPPPLSPSTHYYPAGYMQQDC